MCGKCAFSVEVVAGRNTYNGVRQTSHIEARKPTQNPPNPQIIPKRTHLFTRTFRQVCAKSCLLRLSCDTSQEPNGNSLAYEGLFSTPDLTAFTIRMKDGLYKEPA